MVTDDSLMLSIMKSKMKSLMLSLCYPCDEIRHGSEEKLKKEADLYLNSLFCNENQVVSWADVSVGMRYYKMDGRENIVVWRVLDCGQAPEKIRMSLSKDD